MSEHEWHQHPADHLGHEHATLRQALDQIRHAMERGDQGGLLAELLDGFYEEVERHFADEENGGCFDDAVARAPQLTGRVADLMREHPALLEELRDLCQDARRGADSVRVARRLESFARHWLDHESAENQVLQEAYNLDLGAAD